MSEEQAEKVEAVTSEELNKAERLGFIISIIIWTPLVILCLIFATRDQLAGDPKAGMGWAITLGFMLFGSMAIYMSRPRHLEVLISPRNRIAEIRSYINTTGKLLRELEDELSTRTQVLEQLQADAERYERLASLNQEQAKAIEDMVGQQFKRQSRSTWVQWWGAIVLAGILGFVINWASSPLWDWITR